MLFGFECGRLLCKLGLKERDEEERGMEGIEIEWTNKMETIYQRGKCESHWLKNFMEKKLIFRRIPSSIREGEGRNKTNLRDRFGGLSQVWLASWGRCIMTNAKKLFTKVKK